VLFDLLYHQGRPVLHEPFYRRRRLLVDLLIELEDSAPLMFSEAIAGLGEGFFGRVVLSGSRQLVLVRPVGRLLAMDLLHYPTELRGAAAWEADIRGTEPSPEELRLMGTIIDGAGAAEWSQYRDTSAEEMKALIEAKVAGRPLAAPAEEPVAVLQLLDALKQSVAAAKEKPAAVKDKPHKLRSPRRTSA